MSTSQLQTRQLKKNTSGGYCGGVPPLPIPNREVKPTCADGTAMQCGRVGSRLLLAGAPRIQCPRGSFFMLAVSYYFLPLCFLDVLHVRGKINASPFSKSPPCKFPSCALQGALFLPTLIGSCHPLFIHSQGKGIPSHVALSCQLHTITSHFDAEKLVT